MNVATKVTVIKTKNKITKTTQSLNKAGIYEINGPNNESHPSVYGQHRKDGYQKNIGVCI